MFPHKTTSTGFYKPIIALLTQIQISVLPQLLQSLLLPPASPLVLSGVIAMAIAVGGYHTCAIVTGDGVKCWGWNFYGQLGIGSTTQQNSPVQVPGALAGRDIHTKEQIGLECHTSKGEPVCLALLSLHHDHVHPISLT